MKMFTWGEYLGKPECPYIKRWVLNLGLFSLRIHRWISSDDQRHFHDHPWWYWSLILYGGYFDVSEAGEEYRPPWSTRFYEATHRHSVRIPLDGCWTFLITGPESRQWGFWVNGRFRKRNRYFYDNRHHPCE